jgi:hypothetical protein
LSAQGLRRRSTGLQLLAMRSESLYKISILMGNTKPTRQSISIPPSATLSIDLDVISPIWRDQLNENAHSAEARGSFLVKESPLPIFSSGYFIDPSHRPDVPGVLGWAIYRVFGVYLHFTSNDQSSFGYSFNITPLRFASGPADDPEWEDPVLAPFSMP